MNRAMQLAHLAQAERHIASGLRHIEKQEQIIADLDCNGRDITVAVDVLWTFRDMQDHLVAYRDRIIEQLKQ
jgi:hypothetical protein